MRVELDPWRGKTMKKNNPSMSEPDEPVTPTSHSRERRKLVRNLAAGAGLVAGTGESSRWLKPVVESVVLPAHAVTSGALLCSAASANIENSDGDGDDGSAIFGAYPPGTYSFGGSLDDDFNIMVSGTGAPANTQLTLHVDTPSDEDDIYIDGSFDFESDASGTARVTRTSNSSGNYSFPSFNVAQGTNNNLNMRITSNASSDACEFHFTFPGHLT
ncbi:MAG: hypothetical protein WAL83_10725 [Arenicellales bacterium]